MLKIEQQYGSNAIFIDYGRLIIQSESGALNEIGFRR